MHHPHQHTHHIIHTNTPPHIALPLPPPTHSPKADWQEVDILLDDFTLTWRGRLTESSVQFNPAAVTRMGISVAGGPIQQGEFALDVAWIEGRRGAAGDGVDDDML